jgi:hypothetical protein
MFIRLREKDMFRSIHCQLTDSYSRQQIERVKGTKLLEWLNEGITYHHLSPPITTASWRHLIEIPMYSWRSKLSASPSIIQVTFGSWNIPSAGDCGCAVKIQAKHYGNNDSNEVGGIKSYFFVDESIKWLHHIIIIIIIMLLSSYNYAIRLLP